MRSSWGWIDSGGVASLNRRLRTLRVQRKFASPLLNIPTLLHVPLRFVGAACAYMRTISTINRPILWVASAAATMVAAASDPRVDSWFTRESGRYARIYNNAAAQVEGASVTTWSNGSQDQSSPAYSGVQEIDSSSNWVYVHTTGLGIHVMGPWPSGFPNLPANQAAIYRIPRLTSAPATKTLTGLGAIGYFVDGVAMFDSRDGFAWNGSEESGVGGGYWNRDAFVNEGATFDPAYAHQQQTGVYHYHANPVALRYLLGDHVDFDSAAKIYSESTNTIVDHSPILGWVRDGFPIYGPYGYSNPTNSASGVRRMISGYVLRDGKKGADDVVSSARATLPAWAVRLYGVSASQSGPAVSSDYPLGRYMEDKAYLGDLGKTQGIDFDLDEYNGRFCVTPEFPNGTYAYFVSIAADGTPLFPYNIGRAFYGNPTGDSVSAISETVVTNFVGGPNSALLLTGLQNSVSGDVVLTWSAVEGGSYIVESTTDFKTWKSVSADAVVSGNSGQASVSLDDAMGFFRVSLSSLDEYDSTGSANTDNSGGAVQGPALTSVAPSSGSAGTTVTLVMTLPTQAPPSGINPTSAALGALTSANVVRNGGKVTATFIIPSDASLGSVTPSVVFPGPPGMGNVTFSLANGFSIER